MRQQTFEAALKAIRDEMAAGTADIERIMAEGPADFGKVKRVGERAIIAMQVADALAEEALEK